MCEIFGEPDKRYRNGDGSVLSSYSGRSAADFQALCARLRAAGYRCTAEHTANASRFSTWQRQGALVQANWLANAGCLRTVTSPEAAASLPGSSSTAAGPQPTEIFQLCLPISEANKPSNGMGYVIRLSDGSFLVWDGGYPEQAGQLLRLLIRLHGGEDGIHIRAWAITHGHGDHAGCIEEFSQRYAGRVTVEHLLVALVDPQDVSTVALHRSVPLWAARLGARACCVHTGMRFVFSNLTLDILFAPEDLYIDSRQADFNNSGFVGRLSDDRDSILFLGDVMREVTDWLSAVWGNALQSHQCQVSHHGVDDSTAAFYHSLHARTLWYPCGHRLYSWTVPFAHNIERNGRVREELAESGRYEILLHDEHIFKKTWGSSAPAEAVSPD